MRTKAELDAVQLDSENKAWLNEPVVGELFTKTDQAGKKKYRLKFPDGDCAFATFTTNLDSLVGQVVEISGKGNKVSSFNNHRFVGLGKTATVKAIAPGTAAQPAAITPPEARSVALSKVDWVQPVETPALPDMVALMDYLWKHAEGYGVAQKEMCITLFIEASRKGLKAPPRKLTLEQVNKELDETFPKEGEEVPF